MVTTIESSTSSHHDIDNANHSASGNSAAVGNRSNANGTGGGENDSRKRNRPARRRRSRSKRKGGPDQAPSAEGGSRGNAALLEDGRRPEFDHDDAGPDDAALAESPFAALGLRNSVLRGVVECGFVNPTEIQASIIPPLLAGRHVIGQARTGTGKTAAFGLPLLHMADRGTPLQALILVPTRELAMQVQAEINDLAQFTPIRAVAIYGGDPIPQQRDALRRGPQIVVGTPGRVMDMHERGYLTYDNMKFAVLDEVDRMLDIGFREDIRRILKDMPNQPQTIFVSATLSPEIEALAKRHMVDPVKIEALEGALTVDRVKQTYVSVQRWDKPRLLKYLLAHEDPELTLVFCRMKVTVDKLTEDLQKNGIDARAIHGDMPQRKRNQIMLKLRSGTLSVIVASDLAARGLDVSGITHVVNYDLPEDPEIYVHRIGRTARAGREGIAWAFVTPEEGPLLTAIEKFANVHIPPAEYPGFEPGPVPRQVRAEQEDKARKTQARQKTQSRYSRPVPVVAEAEAEVAQGAKPLKNGDPVRFPGGIAPTKPPKRTLGGRVKTRRRG